ncbi:cytidine deaminase [Lacrimispora sp. NSJ-141]|uniref:Cytidine deaminase n=2 Tax=Lientehia hominis TaxID=2897778 RepID=A0AAP2RG07_9FIRM|nr:cytidine deaminase [Lientehia hominis]
MKQLTLSYAPYSHFHVAAALLCEDGTVYTGCNIENASYSATNCAERTAFFKAVSEGKRTFSCIVIAGGRDGKTVEYCPPCGVCRQVMREFCDPSKFQVVLARSLEDYKVFLLEELLPESFGPETL